MPRQRCSRCNLIIRCCLCHMIRPVDNPTPVYVVQDPQEERHALGTVKFARLGLQHFTVLPVSPGKIEPGSDLLNSALPDNAVLVYPGTDAIRVAPCAPTQGNDVIPDRSLDKPDDVSLVFIDATWRRSKRILFEQPALQRLPRYQLTQVPPPRYTLRKASGRDALSTLEAIVEMLACLDPTRLDNYRRLLATMDQMVDGQVRAMGAATFLNNYP